MKTSLFIPIVVSLGLSQACSGFRNTAEFDNYRTAWKSYDEQMAHFDETQQQCIAENTARDRAAQEAKLKAEQKKREEAVLAEQLKKAHQAAFEANPIVFHNRQLHQTINNIDIQLPSTIRAMKYALEATEITKVNLDVDLVHQFHAEANHCYIAVSIQPHSITTLKGQWLTSNVLGYQVFNIPFYQIDILPKLTGICMTSEAKIAYKLPLSQVDDTDAVYILSWAKSSIPEWLQAQITVNVDADICHPIRWRQLWTNPIPGTIYYYNNEPVLRTDYITKNGVSELVSYTGKYYSLISVQNLTSFADKAELPEGFVHICNERPIMRPEMVICNDNKSVSIACCLDNAKTKTSPIMTESEARFHYCGATQGEVKANMLKASAQIRQQLAQLNRLETFDMTEMMKVFTGIETQP